MAQEIGRVCRIGDWVSFFILAVKLCSDIAGLALGKDRLAMRLSETGDLETVIASGQCKRPKALGPGTPGLTRSFCAIVQYR